MGKFFDNKLTNTCPSAVDNLSNSLGYPLRDTIHNPSRSTLTHFIAGQKSALQAQDLPRLAPLKVNLKIRTAASADLK